MFHIERESNEMPGKKYNNIANKL